MSNNLENYLDQNEVKINDYQTKICLLQQQTLKRAKQNFVHQTELLNAYSPLKTIARGFAIVESDDTIVTTINQIETNQDIKIRLRDGIIRANVINKEEL
jgi:exodeoxyribonuclease VII large subunit